MQPLIQTSVKNAPQTSSPNPSSIDYDFLVIGCGNERCGDQAVGPQVAMAVANWQLPTVKSLTVPQLTPELSAELVRTNYVIFVDACSAKSIRTIQIAPIVGFKQQITTAHHSYAPLDLLNLTQRRYNRQPQAWTLQIPIESFETGCDLSQKAHQGCDQALQAIQQFLITYRQPYLSKKSA